MAQRRAVILFAHGARDPEWANPCKQIQARIEMAHPEWVIRLAFLEFMAPDLPTTVADLAAQNLQHITVIPLFLAQGGHLRHDLPKIIERLRQTHSGLTIELTEPVGEVDAVQQAIADWIVSAR